MITVLESTLEKDILGPFTVFSNPCLHPAPSTTHPGIRMDGVNVLFMAELTAFMLYLNAAMSL